MNAKDAAIMDMIPELAKRNKSFIAFRKELNPIMRRLVSQQIRKQKSINPFSTPSHSNCQLVAHCFFAHGEIKYNDYSKYYKLKEK